MESETKYFYELTPDVILESVEQFGFRCTGRVLALNSMENRVYEVEVEIEEELPPSARERFRVVKFYRPGRWTKAQILEEHQFLLELLEAEIPVIAPVRHDDQTLKRAGETGILCAVFEKAAGRNPDELTDEQLLWVGRLLGRMHGVGASRPAQHRISLDVQTYGLANLEYLLDERHLPSDLEGRYERTVREICRLSEALLSGAPHQRLHGDCHFGNILWGSAGPFFVDFDDMVVGPPVQDIWLLTPGRDEWARKQRLLLLEGYEQMCSFDYSTLKLIEPLRALRMINYSAWIARRWKDPAFPRTFPSFGSRQYWQEQYECLEEQREIISGEREV